MIVSTIIILLFFNLSAQAQIPFPDSLTPGTVLFRGQSTHHTALPEVIKSLFKPGQIVAKSRLYRTLENKFKNTVGINQEMDRYINYLQMNRLFYRMRYCHVDVYDCNFPTLTEFLGELFLPVDVPVELLEKFSNTDANITADRHAKANLLTLFDPFISVTTDIDVARSFAAQSGENGYVLYLKDVNARNCNRENMAKLRCLINHEEYLEELEYPFIGLIYSDELHGVETNNFVITKESTAELTVLDRAQNKYYRLQADKKNCNRKIVRLRKIKFMGDDIKKVIGDQGLRYACLISDSAD